VTHHTAVQEEVHRDDGSVVATVRQLECEKMRYYYCVKYWRIPNVVVTKV